jgi:hypothetical protein
VPGRGAPKVAAHADPDKPAPAMATPSYPAAASVTLAVPAAGSGSPAKAGALPVTVAAPKGDAAAPTKVSIRNLDHATVSKLGTGVAMALVLHRADGQPGAGKVRLTVDYSQFAEAAGGNYAQRLRLVTLPASCATAPGGTACAQGKPVHADNNATTRTLAATVDVSGADGVVALDSGVSSPAGDYRATDLNVAQKWTAGDSGGSFAYSYPIHLPAPPYGEAPELSLDYDSSSVDGRTSKENSQASWVGMGWDINVPFI